MFVGSNEKRLAKAAFLLTFRSIAANLLTRNFPQKKLDTMFVE